MILFLVSNSIHYVLIHFFCAHAKRACNRCLRWTALDGALSVIHGLMVWLDHQPIIRSGKLPLPPPPGPIIGPIIYPIIYPILYPTIIWWVVRPWWAGQGANKKYRRLDPADGPMVAKATCKQQHIYKLDYMRNTIYTN